MEQRALGISAVLGGIADSVITRTFGISILPQLICLILSLKLIEPKVHTRESGNIYSHLNLALKEFFANKKLRLLTLASSTTYALTESSFHFDRLLSDALASLGYRFSTSTLKFRCASVSFHYSGKY